MCVLSIKVPYKKSLETYLMILVYTYIFLVLFNIHGISTVEGTILKETGFILF